MLQPKLNIHAEEGSYKANEYTFQILTKDGVKEYAAASTFYVDDVKYEVKDMTEALDIAKVVVDITFTNGQVKKIYTEEEDVFESVNDDIDGVYEAEDFEIGAVELEEDTVLFFVEEDGGVISKADSYVGTLADLEAGDTVANAAAYFTKGIKADASILVLYNASTGINSASGLAIITDVVEATNADEEDIYELEALYNGKTVALTTTAVVCADNGALAVGDIVKIKVNGNKVVTDLAVVTAAANDRANGESIDADILEDVAGTNETLYEGYASAIKKTSKKITVDGETFSLSKFANIYAIDNTGRKIAIKANGSFNFDEKLYKGVDGAMGLADGKAIEDDATETIVGSDVAAIKDYADYVIIRAYEGSDDVFEMVIIKGADYNVVTAD